MGVGGQRPFAGRVEEAAGFEALLKLLKGDLQRAGSDRLEKFRHDLQLAALFIDGDFAAEQDVKTVGGLEAEERGLLAKEHGRKLRVSVFEGEVDVAGGRGAEVGDFAFDPEVAVFAFDVKAHLANEITDFPDAAADRGGSELEGEAELGIWIALRVRRTAHHSKV